MDDSSLLKAKLLSSSDTSFSTHTTATTTTTTATAKNEGYSPSSLYPSTDNTSTLLTARSSSSSSSSNIGYPTNADSGNLTQRTNFDEDNDHEDTTGKENPPRSQRKSNAEPQIVVPSTNVSPRYHNDGLHSASTVHPNPHTYPSTNNSSIHHHHHHDHSSSSPAVPSSSSPSLLYPTNSSSSSSLPRGTSASSSSASASPWLQPPAFITSSSSSSPAPQGLNTSNNHTQPYASLSAPLPTTASTSSLSRSSSAAASSTYDDPMLTQRDQLYSYLRQKITENVLATTGIDVRTVLDSGRSVENAFLQRYTANNSTVPVSPTGHTTLSTVPPPSMSSPSGTPVLSSTSNSIYGTAHPHSTTPSLLPLATDDGNINVLSHPNSRSVSRPVTRTGVNRGVSRGNATGGAIISGEGTNDFPYHTKGSIYSLGSPTNSNSHPNSQSTTPYPPGASSTTPTSVLTPRQSQSRNSHSRNSGPKGSSSSSSSNGRNALSANTTGSSGFGKGTTTTNHDDGSTLDPKLMYLSNASSTPPASRSTVNQHNVSTPGGVYRGETANGGLRSSGGFGGSGGGLHGLDPTVMQTSRTGTTTANTMNSTGYFGDIPSLRGNAYSPTQQPRAVTAASSSSGASSGSEMFPFPPLQDTNNNNGRDSSSSFLLPTPHPYGPVNFSHSPEHPLHSVSYSSLGGEIVSGDRISPIQEPPPLPGTKPKNRNDTKNTNTKRQSPPNLAQPPSPKQHRTPSPSRTATKSTRRRTSPYQSPVRHTSTSPGNHRNSPNGSSNDLHAESSILDDSASGIFVGASVIFDDNKTQHSGSAQSLSHRDSSPNRPSRSRQTRTTSRGRSRGGDTGGNLTGFDPLGPNSGLSNLSAQDKSLLMSMRATKVGTSPVSHMRSASSVSFPTASRKSWTKIAQPDANVQAMSRKGADGFYYAAAASLMDANGGEFLTEEAEKMFGTVLQSKTSIMNGILNDGSDGSLDSPGGGGGGYGTNTTNGNEPTEWDRLMDQMRELADNVGRGVSSPLKTNRSSSNSPTKTMVTSTTAMTTATKLQPGVVPQPVSDTGTGIEMLTFTTTTTAAAADNENHHETSGTNDRTVPTTFYSSLPVVTNETTSTTVFPPPPSTADPTNVNPTKNNTVSLSNLTSTPTLSSTALPARTATAGAQATRTATPSSSKSVFTGIPSATAARLALKEAKKETVTDPLPPKRPVFSTSTIDRPEPAVVGTWSDSLRSQAKLVVEDKRDKTNTLPATSLSSSLFLPNLLNASMMNSQVLISNIMAATLAATKANTAAFIAGMNPSAPVPFRSYSPRTGNLETTIRPASQAHVLHATSVRRGGLPVASNELHPRMLLPESNHPSASEKETIAPNPIGGSGMAATRGLRRHTKSNIHPPPRNPSEEPVPSIPGTSVKNNPKRAKTTDKQRKGTWALSPDPHEFTFQPESSVFASTYSLAAEQENPHHHQPPPQLTATHRGRSPTKPPSVPFGKNVSSTGSTFGVDLFNGSLIGDGDDAEVAAAVSVQRKAAVKAGMASTLTREPFRGTVRTQDNTVEHTIHSQALLTSSAIGNTSHVRQVPTLKPYQVAGTHGRGKSMLGNDKQITNAPNSYDLPSAFGKQLLSPKRSAAGPGSFSMMSGRALDLTAVEASRKPGPNRYRIRGSFEPIKSPKEMSVMIGMGHGTKDPDGRKVQMEIGNVIPYEPKRIDETFTTRRSPILTKDAWTKPLEHAQAKEEAIEMYATIEREAMMKAVNAARSLNFHPDSSTMSSPSGSMGDSTVLTSTVSTTTLRTTLHSPHRTGTNGKKKDGITIKNNKQDTLTTESIRDITQNLTAADILRAAEFEVLVHESGGDVALAMDAFLLGGVLSTNRLRHTVNKPIRNTVTMNVPGGTANDTNGSRNGTDHSAASTLIPSSSSVSLSSSLTAERKENDGTTNPTSDTLLPPTVTSSSPSPRGRPRPGGAGSNLGSRRPLSTPDREGETDDLGYYYEDIPTHDPTVSSSSAVPDPHPNHSHNSVHSTAILPTGGEDRHVTSSGTFASTSDSHDGTNRPESGFGNRGANKLASLHYHHPDDTLQRPMSESGYRYPYYVPGKGYDFAVGPVPVPLSTAEEFGPPVNREHRTNDTVPPTATSGTSQVSTATASVDNETKYSESKATEAEEEDDKERTEQRMEATKEGDDTKETEETKDNETAAIALSSPPPPPLSSTLPPPRRKVQRQITKTVPKRILRKKRVTQEQPLPNDLSLYIPPLTPVPLWKHLLERMHLPSIRAPLLRSSVDALLDPSSPTNTNNGEGSTTTTNNNNGNSNDNAPIQEVDSLYLQITAFLPINALPRTVVQSGGTKPNRRSSASHPPRHPPDGDEKTKDRTETTTGSSSSSSSSSSYKYTDGTVSTTRGADAYFIILQHDPVTHQRKRVYQSEVIRADIITLNSTESSSSSSTTVSGMLAVGWPPMNHYLPVLCNADATTPLSMEVWWVDPEEAAAWRNARGEGEGVIGGKRMEEATIRGSADHQILKNDPSAYATEGHKLLYETTLLNLLDILQASSSRAPLPLRSRLPPDTSSSSSSSRRASASMPAALIVDAARLFLAPSFYDYLRTGLKLNVLTAIDYSLPSHLHTLVSPSVQQKERIRSLHDIVCVAPSIVTSLDDTVTDKKTYLQALDEQIRQASEILTLSPVALLVSGITRAFAPLLTMQEKTTVEQQLDNESHSRKPFFSQFSTTEKNYFSEPKIPNNRLQFYGFGGLLRSTVYEAEKTAADQVYSEADQGSVKVDEDTLNIRIARAKERAGVEAIQRYRAEEMDNTATPGNGEEAVDESLQLLFPLPDPGDWAGDASVTDTTTTIEAYLRSARSIRPFASELHPRRFAPLIERLSYSAEAESVFTATNQHYSVLFIVTMGGPEDLKETVEYILDATHAPTSIIILGFTNEANTDRTNVASPTKETTDPFATLRDIDDNVAGMRYRGVMALRDNVDFIPVSLQALNQLPSLTTAAPNDTNDTEIREQIRTALAKSIESSLVSAFTSLADHVVEFCLMHGTDPGTQDLLMHEPSLLTALDEYAVSQIYPLVQNTVLHDLAQTVPDTIEIEVEEEELGTEEVTETIEIEVENDDGERDTGTGTSTENERKLDSLRNDKPTIQTFESIPLSLKSDEEELMMIAQGSSTTTTARTTAAGTSEPSPSVVSSSPPSTRSRSSSVRGISRQRTPINIDTVISGSRVSPKGRSTTVSPALQGLTLDIDGVVAEALAVVARTPPVGRSVSPSQNRNTATTASSRTNSPRTSTVQHNDGPVTEIIHRTFPVTTDHSTANSSRTHTMNHNEISTSGETDKIVYRPLARPASGGVLMQIDDDHYGGVPVPGTASTRTRDTNDTGHQESRTVTFDENTITDLPETMNGSSHYPEPLTVIIPAVTTKYEEEEEKEEEIGKESIPTEAAQVQQDSTVDESKEADKDVHRSVPSSVPSSSIDPVEGKPIDPAIIHTPSVVPPTNDDTDHDQYPHDTSRPYTSASSTYMHPTNIMNIPIDTNGWQSYSLEETENRHHDDDQPFRPAPYDGTHHLPSDPSSLSSPHHHHQHHPAPPAPSTHHHPPDVHYVPHLGFGAKQALDGIEHALHTSSIVDPTIAFPSALQQSSQTSLYASHGPLTQEVVSLIQKNLPPDIDESTRATVTLAAVLKTRLLELQHGAPTVPGALYLEGPLPPSVVQQHTLHVQPTLRRSSLRSRSTGGFVSTSHSQLHASITGSTTLMGTSKRSTSTTTTNPSSHKERRSSTVTAHHSTAKPSTAAPTIGSGKPPRESTIPKPTIKIPTTHTHRKPMTAGATTGTKKTHGANMNFLKDLLNDTTPDDDDGTGNNNNAEDLDDLAAKIIERSMERSKELAQKAAYEKAEAERLASILTPAGAKKHRAELRKQVMQERGLLRHDDD